MTLSLPTDLMSRTPGPDHPRIINVSSGVHRYVRRLDLENLNAEKSWAPPVVQRRAKLARILFTKELNRRLWASHVPGANRMTVNAVHPGCQKIDSDLDGATSYSHKSSTVNRNVSTTTWTTTTSNRIRWWHAKVLDKAMHDSMFQVSFATLT